MEFANEMALLLLFPYATSLSFPGNDFSLLASQRVRRARWPSVWHFNKLTRGQPTSPFFCSVCGLCTISRRADIVFCKVKIPNWQIPFERNDKVGNPQTLSYCSGLCRLLPLACMSGYKRTRVQDSKENPDCGRTLLLWEFSTDINRKKLCS